MSGRKIAEYSLHVFDDGREVYFQERAETICPLQFSPFESIRWGYNGHMRVHRLEVIELASGRVIEQIVVRSIKVNHGEKFICPRPHGARWKVHNDDSDNYTVYRRRPPAKRTVFADVAAWLRARAESERA